MVLYKNLKRGEGCEECKGTGTKGRAAIFEVMKMSAAVKDAMLSRLALFDDREQLVKARDYALNCSCLPTLIERSPNARAISTFVNLPDPRAPGAARPGAAAGAEPGQATARALDLTPAAASAALKRLEAELGVALFVRSTRSLRLTQEGALFLEHCRPALAALIFTMFIAAMMHYINGDGFKGYSHAVESGILFIGLFIAGPGKYALKIVKR